MTSYNKLSKTNKRHYWGRGGRFLKLMPKIKGLTFFNASERNKLKRELKNETNEKD